MLQSLAVIALGLLPCVHAISLTLPNQLINGPIKAESEVRAGDLDGSKLWPGANETSYDWWYFDAVSATTNASVTVVFYNTGPNGFPSSYVGDGPFSVGISGSFANGSLFFLTAPVTGDVVIKIDERGTSGEWSGSGFAFYGTSLDGANPTYVIKVDAPAIGCYGTVTLRSRAPPHLPCGRVHSGSGEELFPNVFWANAQPDADAVVDLKIQGTRLQFTDGIGYHDKNWGDAPFLSVTSSWYWGHARLGPYSVVWFDAIDKTGREYFSGYVSQNGELLQGSCTKDAVVVRPWGKNSEYPPNEKTGIMEGLDIKFNLGKGMELMVNVTTGHVLIETDNYVRTEGTAKAIMKGSKDNKVHEGRTLFEEFKFN
ncbi:hypothetical protein J3F84DRAFT_353985 [Trichoderma pleuroticola]